MEIAPGFDSSRWNTLDLDDPDGADWQKAIEIFKSRISGRFLNAADFLIESEQSRPATERRFGFAVLAIDCLMVETLGAFTDGLLDSRGKSQEVFVRFLTTCPCLAQYFTEPLATKFFVEYRCGILHQAEVGGSSRVWSVGDLISEDGGRITVNRTRFHEQLKTAFEDYATRLHNGKDAVLRANFRKKMDFICRQ